MGLRLIEQELTAVLRWEALWNDLPVSFQIPPNGQARLALNSNAKSLSYCSRDVGVCARYRIDPNRNWEREGSATFDGKHSDEDRLLGFVGESVRKPGINAGSKQLALGGGGLRGLPAASSGMTWTTMISLGQREEIIAQYKQMRPAEIGSLKRWIRASGARNAERATVTIACFAPTDPMVYYFVERAKEAVIQELAGAVTAFRKVSTAAWNSRHSNCPRMPMESVRS